MNRRDFMSKVLLGVAVTPAAVNAVHTHPWEHGPYACKFAVPQMMFIEMRKVCTCTDDAYERLVKDILDFRGEA